ncbi:MAG: hypothetical protein LBH59_05100, partial [Planctomycetaceae bacterium]|nr:hypothetical protein [Planctomycetaceae bacterium]
KSNNAATRRRRKLNTNPQTCKNIKIKSLLSNLIGKQTFTFDNSQSIAIQYWEHWAKITKAI